MLRCSLFFRYFECAPNYGIFVPIAKVSLSPSSRKARLSRSGSKESLTSVGTIGSMASTVTSRMRQSGVHQVDNNDFFKATAIWPYEPQQQQQQQYDQRQYASNFTSRYSSSATSTSTSSSFNTYSADIARQLF